MHVIHISEGCGRNLTKRVMYYRVDDGKLLLQIQLMSGGIIRDSLLGLMKEFEGENEAFLILDELTFDGYTLENGRDLERFKLSNSFYPILDLVRDSTIVKRKLELSKDGFEKKCAEVALMKIRYKRNKISVRLMDELEGIKEKNLYNYLSYDELSKFIDMLPEICRCIVKLYEQEMDSMYLYSEYSVLSIRLGSGKFLSLSLNEKVYLDIKNYLYPNLT